jgi:hypothetical protein
MARPARHEARNPQPIEQEAAIPLRQEILQAPTPHRECLLPPERLQTHRYAMRSPGTKLPRIDMSRRRPCVVDIMSLMGWTAPPTASMCQTVVVKDHEQGSRP